MAADGISMDVVNRVTNSSSADEIASILMEVGGPWSLIYYRPDLDRLFVGRDIFGRRSLVWSRGKEKEDEEERDDVIEQGGGGGGGQLLISCSVHRELADTWFDLPYAQLSSLRLSTLSSSTVFSYLLQYPDDVDRPWLDAIGVDYTSHCQVKQDLITVSRVIDSPSSNSDGDMKPTECKMMEMLTNASCQAIIGESEVCLAFSGGVDSLLIAYVLIDSVAREGDSTPGGTTIVLVNASFGDDDKACSSAPDRQRALAAWKHLKETAEGKKVNLRLLLRNVSSDELELNRREFVHKAAAPAVSVLDDSLSCVLWFALAGSGKDIESGQQYSCSSSLVFTGSGADELFAGYARHRTSCEREGPAAVPQECEAELRRLGNRNGGRDARVAAYQGKTLVSPFLDDSFVGWANGLPADRKWDLTLARGRGEKLIIRKALQLLGAAHDAPKQAMQFGSRMAKMSNAGRTVKGSDVSDHLKQLNSTTSREDSIALS